MQYRLIKKFTVNLVFSLLVTSTVPAFSYNAVAQQHYALLLAGGQPEYRVSPQTAENDLTFQRFETENWQQSKLRFVTPDILESIKQQQIQNQRLPDNDTNRPQRQTNSSRLKPGPSEQRYYELPLMGGMGASNPLYDVPAVSPWNSPWNNAMNNPWDNGSNVLYQGQSFPWLPDAAIGGIPPIPMQPMILNNHGRDAMNDSKRYQNNVFNPFTFGSDGNL